MAGERLGAGVDLDAGDDVGGLQRLRERHAGEGLLADRLVVEDGAADGLAQARRGHDHVAIGAPHLLGLRRCRAWRSAVAGRRALVHREQATVAGDERLGGVDEGLCVHVDAFIQGRRCAVAAAAACHLSTSSWRRPRHGDRAIDDRLRFLQDLLQVIRAREALAVDLVDVLGARRPRREPAALRDHLDAADRRAVARRLVDHAARSSRRRARLSSAAPAPARRAASSAAGVAGASTRSANGWPSSLASARRSARPGRCRCAP